MSEYSHAESEHKSGHPGALAQLNQEIERLDKALSMLGDRLTPVTTQYGSVSDHDNVPHPEPSTQLRSHIERLSATTSRLEAMIAGIDL